MADGDPVMSSDLRSILEKALADTDAGARRARILAEDKRTADEVQASLRPLDELLEMLVDRLAEALEAEAARARAVVPADEGAALFIDEADVVEVVEDLGQVAGSVTEALRAVSAELTSPVPAAKKKKRPPRIVAADVGGRRAAGLLYEDVIWLLGMNDGEGALISLERLLVLQSLEGDVKDFVDLNQDKLLGLYQNVLGSFDKVPRRTDLQGGTPMPDGYLKNDKIGKLLDLVDGKRSVQKIIKTSKFNPLETCCILNQLRRSGTVVVE